MQTALLSTSWEKEALGQSTMAKLTGSELVSHINIQGLANHHVDHNSKAWPSLFGTKETLNPLCEEYVSQSCEAKKLSCIIHKNTQKNRKNILNPQKLGL